MLCAAVLAVQTFSVGDVCGADYTGERVLDSAPFKALETLRAQEYQNNGHKVRYYKHTDQTGMVSYRPYTQMGDITSSEQAEEALKQADKSVESMMYSHTVDRSSLPIENKSDPVEQVMELQRMLGNVESLPNGGIAYEAYTDSSRGPIYYRPLARPLNIDSNNPSSIAEALETLNKQLYMKLN